MRCGHVVSPESGMRRRHVDYCDQEQLFAVCKSLQVEDALTAGREPIPVNRKPQRSAGIDLMHAVIALPIPIIFFSATALLVIALPTHLGAGVREAGEDVQQPCDTAEGCGLGKIT